MRKSPLGPCPVLPRAAANVREVRERSAYRTAMDTDALSRPQMAHRSWYMRADVADSLADVVTDLHFATRRPRHEVLAAVIEVAVDHRAEIEARLAQAGAA
jgi:hypothetical protein